MFRELEIQKTYDTKGLGDDPVENFYIPVLAESVAYDRGTGYFSSTVLALAARGISGLIRNGGQMRILTSPELTREDVSVFRSLESSTEREDFIEQRLAVALGDIEHMTNILVSDHLKALAWLLSTELLQIKIVIPKDPLNVGGMLHFKIGILRDANSDQISFSGSNNESIGGWVRNIEQLKVFKSWESEQEDYLRGDERTFNTYWDSAGDSETTSIPLPHAVRKKILSVAPSDANELEEVLLRMERNSKTTTGHRSLREYQESAIDAWLQQGKRGILEMATGTGKTLTARTAIEGVIENSKRSFIVVVAPQVFLANQWAEELAHLNPVVASGNTDWRKQVRELKSEVQLGLRNFVLVIAVQNTAAGQEFGDLINPYFSVSDESLIVVDEVHGAGAPQFKNLLSEQFNYRLGLSATPVRWFDESGSASLLEYFQGIVFTFGIHEALNWVDPLSGQTALCPYQYFPEFVELTDDESEEYQNLSDEIMKSVRKGSSPDSSDYLKQLLIKRARVVKRADNKIPKLREILVRFSDYRGTLVYCSDKYQLASAAETLDQLGITYRRFSGEEGTAPLKEFGGLSEREVIMRDFESSAVDVLLAMKCLDEGIDIPSARRGIILASSTNPREFIQRRGRLLRRAPNKHHAEIYDVIVAPVSGMRGDTSDLNLLTNELKRVEEFAQDAMNEVDIRGRIMEETWKILR
jgi:superfamily II DNA or RNA helicase